MEDSLGVKGRGLRINLGRRYRGCGGFGGKGLFFYRDFSGGVECILFK